MIRHDHHPGQHFLADNAINRPGIQDTQPVVLFEARAGITASVTVYASILPCRDQV
jgi:hypothetical protein